MISDWLLKTRLRISPTDRLSLSWVRRNVHSDTVDLACFTEPEVGLLRSWWPGWDRVASPQTFWRVSLVVLFTAIISLHHFTARPPLPLCVFLGALAAGVTCRLLCAWQSHTRRRCSQREHGQGLWPRKVEQDLAALLQKCALFRSHMKSLFARTPYLPLLFWKAPCLCGRNICF